MMDETDHRRLEGMLYEVDDRGIDLTVWELKFIAGLIDSATVKFTHKQARSLEQIYEERVP